MSEGQPPQRGKSNSRRQPQSIVMLLIGLGLILAALAAFLAIPRALADVQQVTNAAQPLSVDYPAPPVQLTNLDNQPVALSDYLGQVVLYNAWATWCPPCKEEMPTLQAYYQDHRQQGFVVVAIEDGEPAAEVAQFARDYGLSFPVWPDPKWVATTAFKTNVLPSSFVIDRTGRVVLAWSGPITRTVLEKYVTPLITGE